MKANWKPTCTSKTLVAIGHPLAPTALAGVIFQS
jgi:hypothetical protein